MPMKTRPDLGHRSQSNVRRASSRANRTDDQRERERQIKKIVVSLCQNCVH